MAAASERRGLILFPLVVLAALSCNGAATSPPPEPTTVTATAPITNRGTVGAPLTLPLGVRVTDRAGSPVRGIAVRFNVVDGEGQVATTATVTDIGGLASTIWTLGPRVGRQSLSVTASGLPPLTYIAEVDAAPPARLEKIAGDTQVVDAGTSVPVPPTVRVLDRFGNPVAGVAVSFRTVADGSLGSPSAITNGAGFADVGRWSLSRVPGVQSLLATVDALASVSFTATALQTVQALRVVGVPSSVEAGAMVGPVTVELRDFVGDLVTNRPLTVSLTLGSAAVSDATLSGNLSSVSTNGVATFDRLSITKAAVGYTLIASANTVRGVSAPFTVRAAAATKLRFTPGTSLSIAVGQAAALQVDARDAFDNVASAVGLSFVSDNATIARVDQTGVVTGVGAGTAQITAALGSLVAMQTVVVTASPLPPPPTPPALQLTTINTSGAPYGIATSGALVYVTLHTSAAVGRFTTAGATAGTPISVGVEPTDVAFAPNGTAAIVTNQLSGNIGFIDVATGLQTTTMPIGSPFRVRFSTTGARVYVTSGGPQLLVIDPVARTTIASINVGGGNNGLAFSPDGTMLYVTSNFGGIFAINTATNVVVRTIDAPGWLEDIAVAPDGTELYVANENSGIDIYNVASGLRVASIPIAGGAFGLAVTPSGSQLIVTSSRGSSVTLITRTTRVVTQVFSVFGVPRRIAFASGGAIIVISDESGKLHLLK